MRGPGVCAAYVRAAIDIIDDPGALEAVLHGGVCILDAAKRSTASETLAEHFARSTPDQWREVARVIGPRIVWDHMVEPLI